MSTEASRARARLSLFFSIAATALGPACAGTLEDPGRFLDADASTAPAEAPAPDAALDATPAAQDSAPACADVPATILAPKCASAGCHAATNPVSGLDLASPDALARLAGKSATGGPGVLIDPGGNPDQSVLYLKLTPAPPFGGPMPPGAKLSDADLACVRAWIASAPTAGGDR